MQCVLVGVDRSKGDTVLYIDEQALDRTWTIWLLSIIVIPSSVIDIGYFAVERNVSCCITLFRV